MDFLNQFGTPSTFVLAALIAVISFLLLRTSRYYKRQQREEPTWSHATRPRSGSGSTAKPTMPGHSSNFASEMDQWEVEMHDTARKYKAELDSKMSALQALIAEADRAAARLEAALKTKNDTPAEQKRQNSSPLFSPQPVAHPKEESQGAGLHTNQTEALRSDSATVPGVSSKQRQGEIYNLADKGLNNSAIAQRLGMPIGEVELILSLRSKR